MDLAPQVRDGGLLAAGRAVVVLYSGGRDSTCLLDVAVRIAGPGAVTALHVNYRLRDSADEEERHCARTCRELGVALEGVSGSGRKGRITKEDVQGMADGGGPAASEAPATGGPQPAGGGELNLLPWPTVDFEKFGEVERVQRSRIQRISAPNLARNWVMIPHVTHNDEADITELEAWRKRLNDEHSRDGIKFTMVSFLVAACVAALKEFPFVNASLDGEELVLKRYYNIGFAADTPAGLVVPVIKDADHKGLRTIAQFNPLYHCVALVRDVSLNTMVTGDLLHTAVLVVFAVVMWRLAIWRLESRLID